jgi:hypothetical protein
MVSYGYCVCGPWDIFSSSMKMDGSNENSKGPWIFKNLSRLFIKIFQKKISEGILGQTPPPPTKSLHYKTFTYPPPPPPSLINFEKKSLRKFMVPSPLHIKIKMDSFFSCTNF